MKTNLHRVNVLFILLFYINTVSYGQITYEVVLNVDTGEIVKPNESEYCSFGQPSDISNEDYTIFVSNGDQIRWIGVSSSSDKDVVEISSINYQGGKNLLGENVIRGQDGIVTATVRDAEVGDEEKYTIGFKVLNDGEHRNGTFHIDPKIKVK